MPGATFRHRRTLLRTLLSHALFAITISLLIAAQSPAAAQAQAKPPATSGTVQTTRPNLRPKLIPGEVMRYQVEFQTTSDTKRGGAVQDPEGPSHLAIIWDATVRIEVLGGSGVVPLRTTYEQSAATVQSDTPDPQADAIVKQYQQLEGRSIEFTLDAAGNVSTVQGLEGIMTDANTVKAAQQWMAQLSSGSSAPAAGVVPGMTWSSEQVADALPVPGLVWRTDSTYLRDESCHPAPPSGSAANRPDDTCAVILMNLLLSPPRSKTNRAPDEFRQNGLQTKGHWAGSGDSLSYISLRTGWVVSASQSSSQEMDVDISNALGATVHFAGTVQTHSQISLLPPAPAPAATPAAAR